MSEQPPVYQESDTYEKWRSEIQKWRKITSMDLRRQALAVRAKLAGKLRELALKLDAGDLNKDDGMDFLIENLDASFRKERKRKWDVSDTKQEAPVVEASAGDDSNLSAAEKARQTAAKLSAKLAAQGKYQTQPMSLLPRSVSNPVDQFKKSPSVPSSNPFQANVVIPDVKKLDNGGYLAEFDINDVPARAFLTKGATLNLIGQQSGSSVTLKGRCMNVDDKRKCVISGVDEKPLTMIIQASVAAKVQVAVHKISQVIRNYKQYGPDNNLNNYGLTPQKTQQPQVQFIQDKLFVGLDNVGEFNVQKAVAGDNGANFSFISQQSGAKVMLRGRKSGYLEQNSGRESFEALHIYISHPRQDGLELARKLCGNLIDTIAIITFSLGYYSMVRNQYENLQRQPPATMINDQQAYNNTLGYAAPNQHRIQPPQPRPMDQQPPYRPPPDSRVSHINYPHDSRVAHMNYPPVTSVNQYRPPYGAHAPPADYQNQNRHYGNNERNNEPHRRVDQHSDYPYDKNYNGNSREDHSRSKHAREVDRSDHERRRERSRSRSRSPERRRTSHSRETHRSPNVSPEKERDRPSRKFTEEPKKRRKFSEDPKLLEKAKSRRVIDDVDLPPPKLQFRSKKDVKKPYVEPFMPPPPLPPMFGQVKEKSTPSTSPTANIDLFKPPAPINILKPQVKALKMGALSSLNAYADDSDED